VRSLFVALAEAAALVFGSGVARAADADVRTGAPATLSQEIIGAELTPASMALSSSVSRFQGGLGGSIRLLRHRWEHFYVIPFQAGLFVGQGDTVAAHLLTEAGVIVPKTARRLELGLGAGVGAVLLNPATSCASDVCHTNGGEGWMASVGARYLFVDRPGVAMGIGVRAIVPTARPDPIGGTIVLTAFDFAFGRPAYTAIAPSSGPARPAD